jgi:hypothetical protein
MSVKELFMAKLSKNKIVWAINETRSMNSAAKLLRVAYNTFKKYAKLYEVFDAQPAYRPKGIPGGAKPIELSAIFAGNNPNYSMRSFNIGCVRKDF